MRKTKKRGRKLIGGKLIGEGYQGLAFYPALKCNNANTRKNTPLNERSASPFTRRPKTYVTKITSAEVANHELQFQNMLTTINRNSRFTAPVIKVCKAARNQNNINYYKRLSNINERKLNTLAFSRYRGNPISYYQEAFANNEIDVTKILDVLNALGHLLLTVSYYVNGKGAISHNDAHNNNIVYDEDTHLAALIDFGQASTLEPILADKIIQLHRYLDRHPEESLPINISSSNTNNNSLNTSFNLSEDDITELKHIPVTTDTFSIFSINIRRFFTMPHNSGTNALLDIPRLKEWYSQHKYYGRADPEYRYTEYQYLKATKQLLLAIRNTIAVTSVVRSQTNVTSNV